MTQPTRRVWATIDLNGLRKNLAQVRSLCPESGIYPVIKANAYGHGMAQAARALAHSDTVIAGFATATLAEALELRQLDLNFPILLLNGFVNAGELRLCHEAGIEPVVHARYQVELLERQFNAAIPGDRRRLWLKYNSGMNRLGLKEEECLQAYRNLRKYAGTEFVFMSHLGYADDMSNPASRDYTGRQMRRFRALHDKLLAGQQAELECSMAASAGILTLPETHFQYVRPGVMLYGSSPLAKTSGEELGLMPVMTLSSRLIAVYQVKAGESIGYNATYTCDRDTRVGVVSVGYGDGYPRSAANGTPVLVKTAAGTTRTCLIGRVSMDMITIDLTGIDDAQINDEVVLWGTGLSADEVAGHTDTISYELFCKVTRRVDFDYIG